MCTHIYSQNVRNTCTLYIHVSNKTEAINIKNSFVDSRIVIFNSAARLKHLFIYKHPTYAQCCNFFHLYIYLQTIYNTVVLAVFFSHLAILLSVH